MSLDKAIKHGKEHRKPYRGNRRSGAVDQTCRPHGGGTSIPCPWCTGNRTISTKRLPSFGEMIKEVLIKLRSRGISQRATTDEFGDTVWPDSDFLYVEPKR